jgi:transposase
MEELRRQGMSICAIAAVMGLDRKTVRRYLANPGREPRYGPRPGRASGKAVLILSPCIYKNVASDGRVLS